MTKTEAFEWLREFATADGAPEAAGVALDAWHEATTALRELVELKGMKARADAISPARLDCEKEVLNAEYIRRKPTAWHRARAALTPNVI